MAVLRHVAVTLVIAMSAAAAAVPASAQDPLEHEVRAVYLYNFARYITWPEAAFPSATTAVRICVQGTDPVGDALDRAVSGETVNGRPLQAVHLAPGESLRGCHILYVSAADERRVAAALADSRGRPLLTVGEHPRFLDRGGMLRFRHIENRVRFDINLQSIERNGLRVSARLLGVAAEVRRDDP